MIATSPIAFSKGYISPSKDGFNQKYVEFIFFNMLGAAERHRHNNSGWSLRVIKGQKEFV